MVQRLLKNLGSDLGVSGPTSDGVDGAWGPTTQSALESQVRLTQRVAPALQPAPSGALAAPPPDRPAPTVPPAYAWLANLTPPAMVWEGMSLLGTLEAGGTLNNPTIIAWAKEVGLEATYTADSIPWCGLYMALVAKRAGKPLATSPLWALSWAKWGELAGQPRLGDVLTFKRDGGGHVALYIAEDATAYHCLGGNQSDKVCITRIAKERLYAARRPAYRNIPASVKPYIVATSGGLSTNEA